MTRDIENVLDQLIEREGGYVDHPDDLGGPTNFGITESVAHAAGHIVTVDLLTEFVAREIYRTQYYSNPSFDRVAALCYAVAVELVDTGVNMGVVTAVKFLQRSLNALNNKARFYSDIDTDGYIGNQTIAALKKYLDHRGSVGEDVLLKAINCLQGARYIELSEAREDNESFTYGWLRERVVI